jgi:hypothetical protein
VIGPIGSPGDRSGGKIPAGIPARSMSPAAQVRVVTSSSPVVEALVTSTPTDPVSQYASRSGMRSRVSAADRAGVPAAAASW